MTEGKGAQEFIEARGKGLIEEREIVILSTPDGEVRYIAIKTKSSGDILAHLDGGGHHITSLEMLKDTFRDFEWHTTEELNPEYIRLRA